MSSGRYSWTPLTNSQDIRLLSITPADDPEEPIRGHLTNCSSLKSTDYTTLSYAWGPTFEDNSHLTHSILCDHLLLSITAPLYAALTAVRQHLSKGRLADRGLRLPIWVDAICINQQDAQERSSQVAFMGTIYRYSKLLFVWLGDGRSEHQDILRELEVERNPFASGPERLTSLVVHLWKCDWFRRRWVIQELLLSDHVEFMIGQFLVQALQLRRSVSMTAPRLLYEYSRIKESRDLPAPWRCNTLVNNLYLYQEAKCTDPRDRIYALLSISNDAEDFEVNYEYSEKTLLQALATRCVIQGMVPEILVRATCNKPESRLKTPSWVPDWDLDLYSSRPHWEATVGFPNMKKRIWGGASFIDSVAVSNGRLRITALLLGPCWTHAVSEARCSQCAARSALDPFLKVNTWADLEWMQIFIFCPSLRELETAEKIAFLIRPSSISAKDSSTRNEAESYELVACARIRLSLRVLARKLWFLDTSGTSYWDYQPLNLLAHNYQTDIWIT